VVGKVIALFVSCPCAIGKVAFSSPRVASPFKGGPPGSDVGKSGRGNDDLSGSPRGDAGPGPAIAAADPPRASSSRRRREISVSYLLSVSPLAVRSYDSPFSRSSVCRFELVQTLPDHPKFIHLCLDCC
jgi:hypothetical protein